MLSRFSVMKPFVVVVAVIVALILGGVSVTRIKTDLLPDMQLPYLAVITTDPGSTAEKIEAEITDVLESSLATVNGVSQVQSRTSDNVSMIFLEFTDNTDMDAALVKVSSAVNEVAGELPESAGNPNYLEINSDLAATVYIAAHNPDLDIFELSDLVENSVVPELERISGVADVSVAGIADQSVEVRLDAENVDALNAKLADQVSGEFDDAYARLDEAQGQIDEAQGQIDEQVAQLEEYGGRDYNPEAYAEIDAAQAELDAQQAELDESRSELDGQRDEVVAQATIDSLANKYVLAQVIEAQNFSMPAGYIDDADDGQWLLRVGDEFSTVEQISDLVIGDIEGIGEVRVSDVASVTVIDNVEDSYMRINDEDGVLLSVFKSSTASTSEVSRAVADALPGIEGDHERLELDVVSDQGTYISLFISSILRSLLIGAGLAIVVLALFLRDLKPTLIVAFSIPFSVLCALVLMFFSGITLNVLTLGGIALAIGMLVDNSIIVLENIYRLRGRGVSAPRAAVQGAKQITGAVIASTLTTVCVFLPAIFTTGLVNQMLVPFALTITYVLVASLVVALTLVPSVSAYVFKNHTPRSEGWFGRLRDGYSSTLEFFLAHKALPMLVAVGLFAFSVVGVISMGVELIPTMTSKTIIANATMDDGVEKEEAVEIADEILDAALSIDGVDYVGAIDGSSVLSIVSSASGSGSSNFSQFTIYIQTDESVTTEDQVIRIARQLERDTRRLHAKIVTSASSSNEMTSLLGSGLQLDITGRDPEVLEQISIDVMGLVDEVDGYTDIDNGSEATTDELRLSIDRNALAQRGLTLAQVFSAISQRVDSDADSARITVGGTDMNVVVVDETDPLTKEDLLQTEIVVDGQSFVLEELATVEEGTSSSSIAHTDSVRTVTVTAEVEDGENNALLSRKLQEKLDDYDLPDGYTIEFGGEIDNVNTMLRQMGLMGALGFVLIYLIMVAQFQGLLSPFIVLMTVPLAFTGGFLGLLAAGEHLTMLAIMGFLVLMGTVVNNGIVFIDYVNQLRLGGLTKHDALVAAGRTRLRPILMTALTTILSMLPLVFSEAVGGSMQRGMAIVVVGGMVYATFMTLFIVPILYDLLYRRQPNVVDLGDDNLDDDPGDAAEYLARLAALRGAQGAPDTETPDTPAMGLPVPDPRPDALPGATLGEA